MLNFVHLQTFTAVLEAGSFSGAGKCLGYTTSAVSQQIATLERSLEVQLFERGPRSLTPTGAAHRVQAVAEVVLDRVADFEGEIRTAAYKERGRLRIVSFPSAAARVVPRALAYLIVQFPDAEFPILEAQQPTSLADAVASGRADIGVTYSYAENFPGDWDQLDVTPVFEEQVVVLAGRDRGLQWNETLCPSDLSAEPWVVERTGSAGRANFEEWCVKAGFTPRVMLETDNTDALRGLVRENLAIALVPALGLGVDRDIVLRRLSGPMTRRRVFMISRRGDRNPLLADARQAIVEACDHFIAWTRKGFVTDTVGRPLAASLTADPAHQ